MPKGVAVAIKDCAFSVFSRQAANILSDTAIPTCEVNAVSLFVLVSGTNPSATISLEGAPEKGGNYLAIPRASQAAVTSSQIIEFSAPAAWSKVRIASISGTFGGGQGFTIIATPFVSPGPISVTAVVG